MYRCITDVVGLDVISSNPYQTKAMESLKKKTDKIDAKILADLLREDYIIQCYTPNKEVVGDKLVRYRQKLVKFRTKLKNSIHDNIIAGWN